MGVYPKILAFRTRGRKQELIRVAMMMMMKLASYYLDLVLGFMKLMMSSTMIPRIMLLRAEATEETMSRALLMRMVLLTVPQAETMAVSEDRMFSSQKQYSRFSLPRTEARVDSGMYSVQLAAPLAYRIQQAMIVDVTTRETKITMTPNNTLQNLEQHEASIFSQ